MPAASAAAATVAIPAPLTSSGLYGWLCIGWVMVKYMFGSPRLEPRAGVDGRVGGAQRTDQRLLREGAQQLPRLRVHGAAYVRHARADLGALVRVEQPAVPVHRFVEGDRDRHGCGRHGEVRLAGADAFVRAHRGGDP